MREIVLEEFEALGAEMSIDVLGSVHATDPDAPAGPRVMVTAHMDEVGLTVQHITPDGAVTRPLLPGMVQRLSPSA